MRVLFWVTGIVADSTINFSITGEGSIEEECYADAMSKVNLEDSSFPFKLRNINLQKYYKIDDEDS